MLTLSITLTLMLLLAYNVVVSEQCKRLAEDVFIRACISEDGSTEQVVPEV